MTKSLLAILLAAGVTALAAGGCAAGPVTPTAGAPTAASSAPVAAPTEAAASHSEADTPVEHAVRHPVPAGATSGYLGSVISTGLDASKVSEWVIRGISIKNAAAPQSTFGFVLGERHNDGSITDYLTINEYRGSQLAAGFHPTQSTMTLDNGLVQPAFGYYVGHPSVIKAHVDGTTVTAHTAVWSVDTSVTVFWFTAEGVITDLAAYDAHGTQLGRGHVEIWTS